MPGTILTVTAVAGRPIRRGDSLATLEAMKMETTVRAEMDGTLSEVLMHPGMQVDAKDLLAVIC
jgi:pyruvate carboxylase